MSQKELIKLNGKIAIVFLNMKVSVAIVYLLIKYSNKIDEKFLKKFKNTFKFSNKDNNNIILLLRKGIYLYEYIDEWEMFSETTFPTKEDFYNNLNMKNTTDSGYTYAKRFCKHFESKSLVEYLDWISWS